MEGGLKGLIIVSVSILIGVVLLSTLADRTWENQNTYNANDTISVASLRASGGNFTTGNYVNLNNKRLDSINRVVFYNVTHAVLLTEGTDYRIDYTAGTLTLLDTKLTAFTNTPKGNNTGIDYQYGDYYVRGSSTSRTLMGLIPLLFGLAILIFAAGYGLKIMRDNMD